MPSRQAVREFSFHLQMPSCRSAGLEPTTELGRWHAEESRQRRGKRRKLTTAGDAIKSKVGKCAANATFTSNFTCPLNILDGRLPDTVVHSVQKPCWPANGCALGVPNFRRAVNARTIRLTETGWTEDLGIDLEKSCREGPCN